jgi:hypothetical protein
MKQTDKLEGLSQVGSLRVCRGHKCYSLDLRTGDISEVDFPDGPDKSKSLVLDGKHIFVTALNPKNAEKKFNKMLSSGA